MYYKNVPIAIQSLLKETPLEREQLALFFSDSNDAINVPYYLKHMRLTYVIEETSDRVCSLRGIQSANDYDAGITARMLKAFWIIAYVGSENIKWVSALRYPTQFVFLDSRDRLFDITYITGKAEAVIAKQERDKSLLQGEEDITCHIALVPNRKTGEAIKNYGFDCYCLLGEENRPEYVYYER